MRNQLSTSLGVVVAVFAVTTSAADGDSKRGEQAFRQCMACHSLEPGQHLTGLSLANVVGRRAGTVTDFGRYSPALIASGLTWDRGTLERWLADPATLVPETSMRVRPVAEAQMRLDLIAFLEGANDAGQESARNKTGNGAAMGGMRARRMPNLKEVEVKRQVTKIRYCKDAYRVTLGTGNTYTFWEFNLRFKSDSSADGPHSGAPALVGQGMRGDRAQVVFADPGEISAFIVKECPGG
jgi:cytochrome c